ncbi:pentatricopeptide repeat-containing protein At2g36980, mitochondrial isoform X1 [Lactuca sativa]|uniref:Pentatricopeptide repeat-containing protein n=1 Tax=Lactuca sativa TaxID=4236 RepID=A0A9R1XV52_LACSA|nr:pentatricopeptide repeat-containing protein At2g36980, mitochondrial isoform X1 [Lactuca sativa]KAJ0227016.1 hypothetical protein LSAT_V11C100036670 [Lactuca sativa]
MGSYMVHTTSKIASLAKWGKVTCARKLFDEMPQRDTVVWNTMLTSYTHLGLFQEALLLFHEMTGINSIKPDHYSFTATLSACAGSGKLRYGQKIHALILSAGYSSSLPVNNALIDMYAKCLSPCSAHDVFEEIEIKNNVSWCSLLFAYVNSNQFQSAQSVFDAMPNRINIAWNTLIAGHARHGNVNSCVDLFKRMMTESCDEIQDQWTFSALMNAATESHEYHIGCMFHAIVIKKGWDSAVEANNSILSFYAHLSSPEDVLKIFESIDTLTQVSWNAIIDAQMKIGNTQKALITFHNAPEKNVISWTSMISGYVRNGNSEEGIRFFVNMIRSNLLPDDFSLGTVLHACSLIATLGHGKMIHSLAIRHGFHSYAYVGNGLVNMYAKCGDIFGSFQSFNDIIEKDLVSWNTMLISYGLHGWGDKALEIYDKMISSNLKPDNVTFISLLMTCSHLGFVEKGRDFFQSMSGVHGLCPEVEHVACMVDMLARGGELEEAREMVESYRRRHGEMGKSSEGVFGACYAHGELEMLEGESEMSYVVLSNLYCVKGKWKEAEMVRKAMADEGVKKMPGCSWIEVKNKVVAFVAGGSLCVEKDDMSSIIYLLEYQLKNPW